MMSGLREPAFGESNTWSAAYLGGWHQLLVAIAAAGAQISLTYSPTEDWPNEATEKPEERRWQAWATTVPGTDMCQYVHYGANPGEALTKLYAELFPQGAA